jgi:hypothetical protein
MVNRSSDPSAYADGTDLESHAKLTGEPKGSRGRRTEVIALIPGATKLSGVWSTNFSWAFC